MLNIDLNTVADVRHSLRVTIGLCLVLALAIPWAACLWDGLKGRKHHLNHAGIEPIRPAVFVWAFINSHSLPLRTWR